METKGINGASETPLLMITHGKSVEKHLIYNPSEKRSCTLDSFPVLDGKKVLGSSYGWLILVELVDDNDYGDCCLFNPITNDIIKLPKLIHPCDYNQCILTKPPTEPDCYILFNGLEQSFCKIGDEEYVTRTLEQQEEQEQDNGRVGFDNLEAIVSFQGTTYGYMDPDKFVTINFVEPWIIPLSSRLYEMRYDTSWSRLYEMRYGELLMVQKIYPFINDSYEGMNFAVFRIDTNPMKCIELQNIGNRTIFVSLKGAGYCCPSIGTKPNSIYYTNEDDRNLDKNLDRELHIFDLEDRSTKSILPSSNVAANKSIMTSWIQHEIFHST
ncbi:hypothetical protein ABFS83_06G142900 [Erythranthe nasuta]